LSQWWKWIEWEVDSAKLVISSGAASQGWAYRRHSRAEDMEKGCGSVVCGVMYSG